MNAIVTYSLDKNVATVTLNHPEAMNAMNSALAEALGGALEQAADDDDVHVIVITGAGRRR
jgi:enoyl-CoA hydratase/carnithine racemase